MSAATMNMVEQLREELKDARACAENWEANSNAWNADWHELKAKYDATLEREQALAAQIERLDNELQDKALTDDGVLADAYWNCADMITPWLGEKTGPDTLINSVSGSLAFLIEQWREKKELEQARDKRDLIKQAEALEWMANEFDEQGEYRGYAIQLEERATDLRQQAAALDGKGE